MKWSALSLSTMEFRPQNEDFGDRSFRERRADHADPPLNHELPWRLSYLSPVNDARSIRLFCKHTLSVS